MLLMWILRRRTVPVMMQTTWMMMTTTTKKSTMMGHLMKIVKACCHHICRDALYSLYGHLFFSTESETKILENLVLGAALRDNLADLQTEINIKERLIAELERSDRHLAEVRLSYERKLTELSARIKRMEAERDKVVMEAESKRTGKASEEQAKRIREEYERKLTEMRNEFRKLQMVEREHKRMQVDLMKKIKEEMKKAQQQHNSNAKRLAAMDKEARRRENIIRKLENKDRQREQFMKRTNEEINRLRSAQKDQFKLLFFPSYYNQVVAANLRITGAPSTAALLWISRLFIQSRRHAAPLKTSFHSTPSRLSRPSNNSRAQPPAEIVFSPRQAKMKWSFIERKINRLVTQKQTVLKMEEELGRLLEERIRLIDEITSLESRFMATSEVNEREVVAEQIDGCQQKLKYVQDQITETQTAIVDMDGPDKIFF
ncbi:putative flagellar protein FliS [Dictyocaulus viviparus]|uniref:Putative flagellar protein FliS n=1 Tax=Dictyocaulus viviparus TaxID=29172 RepID=A0A0D8XPQ6_DICVI|nr:putative flagellar protein FliS [Dictyocaulus viviparus]